jgi:hypothetical protein
LRPGWWRCCRRRIAVQALHAAAQPGKPGFGGQRRQAQGHRLANLLGLHWQSRACCGEARFVLWRVALL